MRGIMAPKDIMTNTHAKSILNSMNSLRKSNTLCDVTLRVEQKDFPAHRIVLAACSDYFCAMFTSEVRGEPSPHKWSPHTSPCRYLISLMRQWKFYIIVNLCSLVFSGRLWIPSAICTLVFSFQNEE